MRMRTTALRVVRPYSYLAAAYDHAIGLDAFQRTRRAFETLVRRYGLGFSSAADVGCGTGLFACYLNRRWGVVVFAVDRSEEMLAVATRNCREANVRFLKQDIRCLQLPGPVDLITANFDTLNHLVGDGDLGKAFQSVRKNLRPGGHFIFDIITNCQPLGRRDRYVRSFQTVQRSLRQDIRWEPRRKLLSIFVSMRSADRPRPILEVHRERTYSPGEIGRALHEAGFVSRGIHDAATLATASRCPPRIIVVARKKGC